MKDEEASAPQDELARLQQENARLRAMIDRLQDELIQENPAPAQTGARSEKRQRLLMWLMALALSNMCYALAFVFTLAQAEAISIMRSVPWTWAFIFVFASPLLLLFIIGFFGNRIERYILNHTQRTARSHEPEAQRR